jgi:hypothetical protein
MHPHFRDLLTAAAPYRVPELWFPTNLLPLTEATAEISRLDRIHRKVVIHTYLRQQLLRRVLVRKA